MRDQKVKLLAKVANDLCFEAARLKVYEKEQQPRYAEIQQEYETISLMLIDYNFLGTLQPLETVVACLLNGLEKGGNDE